MHLRSFRCRLIHRRLAMLLVSAERQSMRSLKQTGVKIDITDDGAVSICGTDDSWNGYSCKTADRDYCN